MPTQRTTKALTALCLSEALVGIIEIGLALAYLIGITIAPTEIPRQQVATMAAIYAIFVATFIWSAIVAFRSGKNKTRLPKVNPIAVAILATILATYLAIQIITGLATRSSEEYFLISLSWNIPRLLLNLATITCCLIYWKSSNSSRRNKHN